VKRFVEWFAALLALALLALIVGLLAWSVWSTSYRQGHRGDNSHLRFEHRELAPHQRIVLLIDIEEVLGVEVCELAPVLTLPGTLLPNIFWDDLVEGAVAADDEQVEVGDGAEGLVLRQARSNSL
jgi:hypothetical protein